MSVSGHDSPLHAIAAFSEILERLKISYLIGGSFASSVHGEFRTTNDIDYLVKISEEHLQTFFKLLTPKFDYDDAAIRNAVRDRRSFNIFHEETFIKIDVFTRVDPYQEEQLGRAQYIELPGMIQKVKVATPEDIILSKLAWYRLGNEISDRQWRDILGVLKVQSGKLEEEYLRTRANRVGVSDLLEKALKEKDSYKT